MSNSPGNQLKTLLGYDVDESSSLLDDAISAVMEVYASNQTLLRTSSLPEPITLENSEGSIELATTFNDDGMNWNHKASRQHLKYRAVLFESILSSCLMSS